MGRRREITATDLGLNLDRFASPANETGWVWLYGCEPWEGWLESATRQGRCYCPVCMDQPRAAHYCLHCDKTGQDGRRAFPGEPVGSRINQDYHAEATSYSPDPDGLKGGVGD